MSRIRALVCDDDSSFRMMVRELLEERGVEVIEAQDGQEAIGVFMRERVDLVVTDFLMPRIDGLQVIRAIRMSGEKAGVPVVLMSAISRGHLQAADQAIAPDYYVNKPFRPKKMAQVLDRVMKTIRESLDQAEP